MTDEEDPVAALLASLEMLDSLEQDLAAADPVADALAAETAGLRATYPWFTRDPAELRPSAEKGYMPEAVDDVADPENAVYRDLFFDWMTSEQGAEKTADYKATYAWIEAGHPAPETLSEMPAGFTEAEGWGSSVVAEWLTSLRDFYKIFAGKLESLQAEIAAVIKKAKRAAGGSGGLPRDVDRATKSVMEALEAFAAEAESFLRETHVDSATVAAALEPMPMPEGLPTIVGIADEWSRHLDGTVEPFKVFAAGAERMRATLAEYAGAMRSLFPDAPKPGDEGDAA